MIKKEKQILLRVDTNTYQMIKFIADKYDVSINHEINYLLKAYVSKWKTQTIKVHDIPRAMKQIQEDMTPQELKEYNELLESISNKRNK